MDPSTSSQAPTKRPKIDQSLNPFEKLHSDVHELIFQHFGSKDVLQTSVVSRSCFAATESSKKCGDKLWLHVKGRLKSGPKTRSQPSKPLILMDLNSLRKYRNIKITDNQYLVGDFLSLMKSQKWKQIEIRSVFFCAKKEMLDIFKSIQANVETIKCEEVRLGLNIKITDDDVAELTFPMLKELKITDCFGQLDNFFVGCKSLKKLHYACNNLRRDSKLEKILGNNSNLEASLHFSPWSLHESQAFFESIIRHQFKLRALVIRTNSSIGEADLNVIVKLLERQAENLEQLELGWLHTMTYEAIETILKLPNLKSLGIGFNNLKIRDWVNVQLTSNSSIDKLEFHGGSVGWIKFLSKLIQSMPNLKSLRIPRLNDDIMQFLGPLFTNIEELSVDHLVLNNTWFDNVRVKSKDSNIRIALKKNILAKSPEHRSELEKLIIGDTE